MFLRPILFFIVMIFLAGCSGLTTGSAPQSVDQQVKPESVKEVSSLQVKPEETRQTKPEAEVVKPEVKVVKPEVEEAKPKAEEAKSVDSCQDQTDIGDLLVIGEAEYVYIGSQEIKLAARIDTGATTSSLGAKEIKVYESDGKRWVRFKIVERKSGKQTSFKLPLSRTASIKRHKAEDQKRYVVKLPIRLGTLKQKIEFSLTDRSAFEYPVLIGRNFLKGAAVVDVNRKYSASSLRDN